MSNHETARFLEANPELLRQFSETFIARWDTYPFQLPDGAYTRAQIKYLDGTKTYPALTLAHIERHLRGAQTLGVYLLNAESVTRRIVLDDDSSTGLARLRELAQDFDRAGIPSQLEQSSRGGHLWIHTPPLSGKDARRLGIQLLKSRGLTTKDIELYPKQACLQGEHVGSLVRLPLGRHLKTSRFYGFIDLDGRDLAQRRRDQLALIANPRRVAQHIIDPLLAAAPDAQPTFQMDARAQRRFSSDLPPDEKIKRAIAPLAFIAQYVDLDSAGRGLCPFHDDHRQSLKVYADGWHCFAGCEGNTIIDFYIQWKGYASLALPTQEWKQVLKEMLQLLGL